MRWLREDGHLCRPGEVIAYCSIGLTRIGAAPGEPLPFADEMRDLQMALVTPAGGRLRRPVVRLLLHAMSRFAWGLRTAVVREVVG